MKKFRDFKSAREFARKLNLKSQNEWQKYCKSGNKPNDILVAPNQGYKNKGWKGFGDFLGTGTIPSKDKIYRQFESARAFVRSLGLKNHEEWQEYCASGNKPDDIPKNPWDVYKEWNIKRREGKK